jgi:hypothetical protein
MKFSTNNVFPNSLSFQFLTKPHLFVILTAIGWFILNIQSDLFWHRCLEILCLLNNTCVQYNFKSVHVTNLFWSREYNSAKEICKYASFSKVGHSRVDNVINDSFNYTGTRYSWNCQELLKKYIIFRSVLIHVLAHFQRTTVPKVYM